MKNCGNINKAKTRVYNYLASQNVFENLPKEISDDVVLYPNNFVISSKLSHFYSGKDGKLVFENGKPVSWEQYANRYLIGYVKDTYGMELPQETKLVEFIYPKEKNKYSLPYVSFNEEVLERIERFAYEYPQGGQTLSEEDLPQLFDKELAQKIQNQLEILYPEIELNITNTPIWEQGNTVFNQEEYSNQVSYRLKAAEKILDNLVKIKQWESNKSIDQNTLWKKIGEFGIPKQQLDLLKESKGNTVDEKLASFIANYSYTVEINTTKKTEIVPTRQLTEEEMEASQYVDPYMMGVPSEEKYLPTQYYSNLTVPGGTNYTEQEIATPAITPSIKGHAQFATDKGIGWFRSDDKTIDELKGNWIKNESELPDEFVYSSERYFKESGEWQTEKRFIEDIETVIWRYNMSLGNERIQNKPESKTRRILEVQSDLFQKGRDKFSLIKNLDLAAEQGLDLEEVQESLPNELIQNNFLQLLNKDNNWVTFFVKSIIQDSAKKGYEKVLLPSGNTASKIEGHTTLEEFKKQKEDRIKELENNTIPEWQSKKDNFIPKNYFNINMFNSLSEEEKKNLIQKERVKLNQEINSFYAEIEQLKQELERVETEGFGALRPIFNFYENTVTNVLKKQGYSPTLIIDEYGNTWNEVNINHSRDLFNILLQRNEVNQIIGQANIKAMTVLVDAINQKQDTLPHEYAHHYIAWFRDTPIVQEAIKKWGSEEALVQSIGEQAVKQKGEAWEWWKKFTKFVMDLFNNLSTKDKQELTNILTDAFLQGVDLETGKIGISRERSLELARKTSGLFNQEIKPGVAELFESNSEFANAVYSKILTNSGLSAENLLSLLLKDNLIEKQCS